MVRLIVDNVHVAYPIYNSQQNMRRALFARTIGGLIQSETRRPNVLLVNALNGVSLDLMEGDRLGLVGHNGAGKSTLLRVMAGIYEPVAGRVLVEGRMTPLFDTMPGLDGEDTGYENIVTAGYLHGMTHAEIERKIPYIESFSGLGEFLSLPYRTYSSGMMMRLGFSIATAVDPEILLMDEGIGAGDASFAERATKRLEEFAGESRIMVLASHSEQLLRKTCNRAALMQSGRIMALGSPDEIFARYRELPHAAAPEPVLN